MAEQLICNQQVDGSTPFTSSINMGRFPSGQREQTVNLLSVTTMVRIHLFPPKKSYQNDTTFFIQTAGLVYHPCSSCRPQWRHLPTSTDLLQSIRTVILSVPHCHPERSRRISSISSFRPTWRNLQCHPQAERSGVVRISSFFIFRHINL